MKPLRVISVSLALLSASAATAELAVFSSGHFLRVAGFEVTADTARLELESGGVLTVPLATLERLVDDELLPPEETNEIVPRGAGEVDLGFRTTDAVPETPFGGLIFETAKRHAVSPRLVAAMARNRGGDRGAGPAHPQS